MASWGISIAFCMAYIALGGRQSSEPEIIGQYQEELQRHPSNSLAHFRLGELFFEQANSQAAANEF